MTLQEKREHLDNFCKFVLCGKLKGGRLRLAVNILV